MGSDFSSKSTLSILEQKKRQREQQQQFLSFVLLPDTNLMLPLQQISAVLKIPYGQIIPISDMASWVMGVYNWRGAIIWMIDLGHLVGLTRWYQQPGFSSNHKAILIHPSHSSTMSRTSEEIIGLVVSDLKDIEWCNPNKFHAPPPSAVTIELATFLQGYWVKDNGEILVALDSDAILAAMPKN